MFAQRNQRRRTPGEPNAANENAATTALTEQAGVFRDNQVGAGAMPPIMAAPDARLPIRATPMRVQGFGGGVLSEVTGAVHSW